MNKAASRAASRDTTRGTACRSSRLLDPSFWDGMQWVEKMTSVREKKDARQMQKQSKETKRRILDCLGLNLLGRLAGSLVGGNLLLLLGDTLGKDLLVLLLLDLLGLRLADLERAQVTLALETLGGHKTLDLGSLGVWLGTLLLGDDLTANDKLANVVLLGQVEELSNVVGTLGTETLGDGRLGVGETGDLLLTLLDNNEVKSLDIGADDAATNRLALALTGAARAVARVTLGEQKADTVGEKDTLLHGETLLVVTTADAEDVALPLLAERVDLDVLRHALLVEASHETLILDVERLLGTRGRVSNVELHL